MTKSKLDRLRAKLIEKHGDRTLVIIIDRATNNEVFHVKLSNVNINNTAELKEVERILMEKEPRRRRVSIPKPPKEETPTEEEASNNEEEG